MKSISELIIIFVLCSCIIVSVSESANAFSEVQNYFLDGGVRTLGRGGFAPVGTEPESMVLDDPLTLRIASSAEKLRFETTYEYQRILKLYSGRWKGTHADSDTFETVAAIPFSFMKDDLKLIVAIGYAFKGNNVHAFSEKDKTDLTTNSNYDSVRGGLFLSYREKLMAAMTIDGNDYVSGVQLPFEVRIQPIEAFALGYRQNYFHFKADIQANITGNNGMIPFSYNQQRRQLYGEVTLFDDLFLRIGADPANLDNLYGEGRMQLPYGFYLAGSVSQQKIDDLRQPFTVGNDPGGHIDVRLKDFRYRIGVGFDINDQWNTEFNYVHSKLELDGGGVANARAVVDFWPSLIVGNYNYLYSGGVSTDQFQLSGAYQGTRCSFQTGIQYIHMQPSFQLDYWRSALFGFGRAGAGNERLTTDSVDIVGLFFGFGYRLGPATFNYAIGQFIPFATHENKADSSEPGGGSSGSGSGGGKDVFEQIGDKISHHPGGLIQRLQLTVEF